MRLYKKRKRNGTFFFSSRRRHTRFQGDWSSDVCSSDLEPSLPTLQRILSAAGARVDLRLVVAPALPDAETLGHRLAQVLELAEHLPRRPALLQIGRASCRERV